MYSSILHSDIQVRIHVCCFRLLHCIQHLLQQPWVVHVCSLEFYDDIFVGPGKEFQKAPGKKDLSLATPRCVRPCRSFVNQLVMYAYILGSVCSQEKWGLEKQLEES